MAHRLLVHRGHVRALVLVQEALDGYLANLRTDEVDLLLGLEGVLSESDADELRSRISDVRTAWRAS